MCFTNKLKTNVKKKGTVDNGLAQWSACTVSIAKIPGSNPAPGP